MKAHRRPERPIPEPEQALDASKVALILVGELRTFRFVSTSLAVALLQPLAPDVFAHVSLGTAGSRSMNKEQTVPIEGIHQARERLERQLHPVWLRIADPLVAGAHAIFERLRESYAAICAHEQRERFSYTWLLRTRPDLGYRCIFDRGLLAQLGGAALLAWDHLVILPRVLGRAAMEQAANSFECRVRFETCVAAQLARANASFYDMDKRLVFLFRSAVCAKHPPTCPMNMTRVHCKELRDAAAVACTKPELRALALEPQSRLSSCTVLPAWRLARRRLVDAVGFRQGWMWQAKACPWCQCTRSRGNVAFEDPRLGSPCARVERPTCCRFRVGKELDRARIDARARRCPSTCEPWYTPQQTEAGEVVQKLRAYF